jgi:hypothetical protein
MYNNLTDETLRIHIAKNGNWTRGNMWLETLFFDKCAMVKGATA